MSEDLLTGSKLRDMMSAAARCLENNKEAVNALNVFPVPDGDTGTNMGLTVASAVREMDKVTGPALGDVVKALALGSLMGARGNSGVILSQLFRGLAKSLQDRRTATPLQLAWAMQEGVETAYKAVMKPVEGTMLTVGREAARAALQRAKKGGDLTETVEAALTRGRVVLEQTPEMLPVLKQAGVVDAGGAGLLYLIEGALQGLSGALAVPSRRGDSVGTVTLPAPEVRAADAPGLAEDITFAYDTQLLIRGENLSVERIREELEPLGDSLLVVGDPSLVKVHVHTNQPHQALGLCLAHGELIEASVENMREQSAAVQRAKQGSAGETGGQVVSLPEFRGGAHGAETDGRSAAAPPVTAGREGLLLPPLPTPQARTEGIGVVVVSTGDGLESILRNLGADVVVSGGQTMNPSTEDLLRAVESLAVNEVIILPNNGNIMMAAKQVDEVTAKTVRVVPTKSVPQGIAALVALNQELDLDKNCSRMEQAARKVRSGEVTFAVRDSRYNDIEIHAGDFIGLLDDDIVTVGADSLTVLASLVGRMADSETEVITVFLGGDVPDDDAPRVRARLEKVAPHHELEVHRGNQPLYHYLVAVE